MIYTLTLNPAIDKTVVCPGFAANTVNRIQSVRTDVGGKGVNVSKCLLSLGCKSTAAAFWGGSAGSQGAAFLEKCGIGSLAVRVAGETRTNLKIVDPELRQNTDVNEPGPPISGEELDALLALLDGHVRPGDILILSGSIPRGLETTIYRDLILRYRAVGVRVFLDADGPAFREGVSAAPYLIKPNIHEFCEYLGGEPGSEGELITQARQLIHAGVQEIVISLGAEGALLVGRDRAYRAGGLQVPVCSTVGAGDSMMAALAFGIQQEMSQRDRLALAIAISAASVMCSGTQAPEMSTVKELVCKVHIEEVV